MPCDAINLLHSIAVKCGCVIGRAIAGEDLACVQKAQHRKHGWQPHKTRFGDVQPTS